GADGGTDSGTTPATFYSPDLCDEWGCYLPDVPDTPIEMDFVTIPAGTFVMGSPDGELGRSGKGDYAETQHEVTLTRDFFIGRAEVSVAQFRSALDWMLPTTLDYCPDCPVIGTGEHCYIGDALILFTVAMSLAEGLEPCYECLVVESESSIVDTYVKCHSIGNPYECQGYRLPTEAEWEYAARAGTSSAFSNGADIVDLPSSSCEEDAILTDGTALSELAWYCGAPGFTDLVDDDESTNYRLIEVDSLAANPWGLKGVHGNAMELVHDELLPYSLSASTDPYHWDERDTLMVARGGASIFDERGVRTAIRLSAMLGDDVDVCDNDWGVGLGKLGLRVARTAP
ncbi:formylglycine-generating enzyme family protein, partial [Myxococcota bacterium]|nr:formylglycine-generating enzyme family protein [Myxococcota bacterium]